MGVGIGCRNWTIGIFLLCNYLRYNYTLYYGLAKFVLDFMYKMPYFSFCTFYTTLSCMNLSINYSPFVINFIPSFFRTRKALYPKLVLLIREAKIGTFSDNLLLINSPIFLNSTSTIPSS